MTLMIRSSHAPDSIAGKCLRRRRNAYENALESHSRLRTHSVYQSASHRCDEGYPQNQLTELGELGCTKNATTTEHE